MNCREVGNRERPADPELRVTGDRLQGTASNGKPRRSADPLKQLKPRTAAQRLGRGLWLSQRRIHPLRDPGRRAPTPSTRPPAACAGTNVIPPRDGRGAVRAGGLREVVAANSFAWCEDRACGWIRSLRRRCLGASIRRHRESSAVTFALSHSRTAVPPTPAAAATSRGPPRRRRARGSGTPRARPPASPRPPPCRWSAPW